MIRVARAVWASLLIVALATQFAHAQDDIPTTSGFSGFILAGPGYFNVQTNLIAEGSPLLGDAGSAQVGSLLASPSSESVPAFLLAGELNYTFSSTRTQLFLGNRLEDILRLDVILGLGVRQGLPDDSIAALSLLSTPLDLKFWVDPYIEGEDRTKSGLDFPGVRLRWGRILRTGLELTATARRYQIDVEKSGNWLVSEGRLTAAQLPLLVRDGNIWRFQALYRFDVNRHRFEPAVRYVNDAHEGGAVANKGYAVQLTYLYRTPKIILDANAAFGSRNADEAHPVYDQVVDTKGWGAGLTIFVPVTPFKTRGWSVFASGEIFRENANVDFFDASVTAINAGLMWRHRRP